MTIVQSFDLVHVPFPFTDRRVTKRRPALVPSQPLFQQQSCHLLLVMLTIAKSRYWPSDWPIEDLQLAGLPQPCVVRFKLFTLDQSLLLGALGRLSAVDQQGAINRFAGVMAINPED